MLKMQNVSSEFPFCPSFSSYSDNNELVDIARTVSRDFNENAGLDDDEEFEFVNNVSEIHETSSFPIFNRDLLLTSGYDDDDVKEEKEEDEVEEAIRLPLKNLFIRDGDLPSSSSSSEADELEGVPAETYCVWKPKQSVESSPNRCKKSNSTGSSSSKRWRLIKDLLMRSNSDSKVSSSSVLFLNFDKNNEEKVTEKTAKTTTTTSKKKNEGEGVQARKMKKAVKPSAHEVFYVRNKVLKEGDKRRSYLPYRPDLVGIFANVHGLGRNIPPF